jgi:hypothetical protein
VLALKEVFDLTDTEALEQLEWNAAWQYAGAGFRHFDCFCAPLCDASFFQIATWRLPAPVT